MKKGPFEFISNFFFWAFSWVIWTVCVCSVMTHEKFTEVKKLLKLSELFTLSKTINTMYLNVKTNTYIDSDYQIIKHCFMYLVSY